jgi:hypothetical protein
VHVEHTLGFGFLLNRFRSYVVLHARLGILVFFMNISFFADDFSLSDTLFFLDIFPILSISLGVWLLNKGLTGIPINIDWWEILENSFSYSSNVSVLSSAGTYYTYVCMICMKI